MPQMLFTVEKLKNLTFQKAARQKASIRTRKPHTLLS